MDESESSLLTEQLRRAAAEWDEAVSAAAHAPPDAGFAERVRELAKAARQQQGAFALAAARGRGWRSRSGTRSIWISYELRPGAGSRPVAPELWERFDRAVRELGEAFEGVSLHAISEAYAGLADIAREIASELERAASKGDERGGGSLPSAPLRTVEPAGP